MSGIWWVETIDEDVDSLNKTRWKIREWVNGVGYPLWTFKISCDDDATKESIDKVVWLIGSIDREINREDIKESLYLIKDVRYDLGLLINREKARELFTEWLKDIENVSISDEEIETVVGFLNQNMQAEVASWNEDKAMGLVKDWKLKKLEENEVNTKIENELVDILKDIFKLQDVDSLNQARWKIREWVNNVAYPLWTFKVSCDNDAIKKGIDKIIWIIRSIDRDISQKISQKEINESLDSIKDVRYDLNSLINREKAKKLFTKWLKEIKNVNISDEEIETVVDFLNKNMQTEVVSWDEDKVRALVKDWQLEEVREQEGKLKKEFIDILKDIFKLQDVDDLNEARWKVKEWVNNVEYPLWTFKVSCDNDAIKKGIDKIVWLIRSIDRDISQKEITESLNSIKDVRYDLNSLINRENAKELFTKWLKEIKNVSISDEEIETVVGFLNQRLRKEVSSWDEDKVRAIVKDWQLEKIREQKEKENEARSQNGNGERVGEVKQKIQNYSSGSIKELLIKLIDNHPELCRLLEKYLE